MGNGQEPTAQTTAGGRVACLTRSTSGSSMPSKVICSWPAWAADPGAGAHQEANSEAVVSVPDTFAGVALMWICLV